MTRYARIDADAVMEIFETDGDITEMFHPSLIWVVCEDPTVVPGWSYVDGVFAPPRDPEAETSVAAAEARLKRDELLATVYDPGINMALRALRMATATADKNAAKAKVAELDEYAEALVAVPQQEGFPHSIAWPEAPTKESSV